MASEQGNDPKALLARDESQSFAVVGAFERKLLARVIAGMANTAGGIILVGAHGQAGAREVVGVDRGVGDRYKANYRTDFRADDGAKPPSVVFEWRAYEGKSLIVAHVWAATSPAVLADGSYWARVGTRLEQREVPAHKRARPEPTSRDTAKLPVTSSRGGARPKFSASPLFTVDDLLNEIKTRARVESVSGTVRAAMSAAVSYAQRGPPPKLDTASLLAGVIRSGLDRIAEPVATAALASFVVGRREQLLEKLEREYFDEGAGERSEWPTESDVSAVATRGALYLFRRAQEHVEEIGRQTHVSARHLVAALVDLEPWMAGELEIEVGAHDYLRYLVVDQRELWLDIRRILVEDGPRHERDYWSFQFALESDEESTVPQFQAEGFEGEDLLDITRDVDAFATLIAAQALQPPLSIGLFGDWGSGKSFFMKKLQRRIQRLARESGGRAPGDAPPAYHDHIVQIEFNAWHYVETNLWASLVTHLFESLHRHFSKRETDRAGWTRLLRKLDESQLLRDDAEQALSRAQDAFAKAQREHAERRVTFGEELRALWIGLRDGLEPEKPEGGEGDGGEGATGKPAPARNVLDVRKDIARVERILGAEEWRALEREFDSVGSSARQLRAEAPSVFRRAFAGGMTNGRGLITGGVGFLVALGLALWLVSVLPLEPWFRDIGATVVQIVGLATAAAAWVRRGIVSANGAVESLDRIRQAMHDELDRRPATRARLDAAIRSMQTAEQELESRRSQIEELRGELEALRPSRRLSTFLSDRANSDDYRKHLGLPAMIRRDFERLQELLDNQATERFTIAGSTALVEALDRGEVPERILAEIRACDTPLDVARSRVTRGSGQLGAPRWVIKEDGDGRSVVIHGDERQLSGEIQWDLLQIDRIVLYIDDLDRCPPERVSEVLQAVHLLLAFPLFVVVVGVDARWISRSLELRFAKLWASAPEDEAATPADYLEKIFQIAFWLQPMTPRDTLNYIDGLITSDSLLPSSDGRDGPGEAHAEPAAAPSPSDHATEPKPAESPETPGAEPKKEAPDPEPEREPVTGDEDDGHSPQASSPGSATSDVLAQPVELNPEPLKLAVFELDFMKRLAPVLGRSPRSVKRFVNVYRLIRAGVPGPRRRAFVGTEDEPGTFEAVLTLLAIVIGAPLILEDLFALIADDDQSPDLARFVNEFESNWGEDPRAKRVLGDPNGEWRKLRDFLRINPDIGALGMHALQMNLAQVGRYSFRVRSA